ncbi:TonB-dependent receptor [Candidatus Methylacidiphilum infernorum]|uniref:Outer membrane receptor protein, mostly Fe transport n=1 Tax=Methylacidiphilum infernorum (isolate V4) TaxID=481448 RepID=B3DVP6_METI4|nr:TonB-dependent receptor [Candidatus Methylacidiphilum infernorum]ACD83399.1 Outer membrane receptor protein, mostly Fe transport [Methylacidiphilum infernorum V4]
MVENFDLVEGPPGAVFGATQPSNGYVNYITKQPHFDKFRGYVWDTTGMYENYMWGADIGGPVDKEHKVAYRFSYMGIENGSYYQYVHNNQQNFYFALGYNPSENYQADLYFDYGNADYTPIEVLLDRPTQSLIDNGLYITGFLPPSAVTAGTENNPPANTYLNGELPISRRATVKYPGDIGQANFAMTQLIQRIHVNDNLEIVNNTFFWYQDQTAIRFETYEANVFKGDYEIDNRTEARTHFDTDLGSGHNLLNIKHFIDSGFEFRFQRTLDYQSEVYLGNSWDAITENPQLYNFLLSNNFGSFGLYPIPGSPAGGYFIPLNDETNQTQFFRLSPFYQHQMNFSDKIILFVGTRMDGYFVHSQTPPGTPGFLFQSLNTTQLNPLVNAAITYRPARFVSLYFNYNWQYTTNASGGGGYSPLFPPTAFHLLNQLIEGGVKWNLLNEKLYISLAGFSEDTYLGNIEFPATPASFKGLEANLTFQPDKHFWIRLGYLLEQGIEDWSGFPEGPEMAQTYSTQFAKQYGLPLNND